VNPQVVPSQVAVPCAGTVQAVHDVPQLLGLALGWHVPEQSWVPVLQTPEHEAAWAMHWPAHSLKPVGHEPPQLVPSQVADPPIGTGQATQAMPQLATSVLITHWPVQMCVPAPQTVPTSGLWPASGCTTIGLSAAASTVEPPAPFLGAPPAPPSVPLSRSRIGVMPERAPVQPPPATAIAIIRGSARRAAILEVEVMLSGQ
jgi:hypothetical protein